MYIELNTNDYGLCCFDVADFLQINEKETGSEIVIFGNVVGGMAQSNTHVKETPRQIVTMMKKELRNYDGGNKRDIAQLVKVFEECL